MAFKAHQIRAGQPFWFQQSLVLPYMWLTTMHYIMDSTKDLVSSLAFEESLHDKIVKWKSGLEAIGLKMNPYSCLVVV